MLIDRLELEEEEVDDDICGEIESYDVMVIPIA